MTLCDSNRPYLSLLIPKLQLPLQPFPNRRQRGTFAAPDPLDRPRITRVHGRTSPAPLSVLRTNFARIRKPDAASTISQPRYGRNQPSNNHAQATTQPIHNPTTTRQSEMGASDLPRFCPPHRPPSVRPTETPRLFASTLIAPACRRHKSRHLTGLHRTFSTILRCASRNTAGLYFSTLRS